MDFVDSLSVEPTIGFVACGIICQPELGADVLSEQNVLLNQLRLARKSFADRNWYDWIERFRARLSITMQNMTISSYRDTQCNLLGANPDMRTAGDRYSEKWHGHKNGAIAHELFRQARIWREE